jgi:hypothetical protein
VLGNALGMMADSLAQLGDLEGAVSALNRLIPIQQQVLGPKNPLMAETYRILAGLLKKLGRPQEADAARNRMRELLKQGR